MNKYPSQERLRELFDYDKQGFLVWRKRGENSKSWNTRYAGTNAGSLVVTDGLSVYSKVTINLDGKKRYFTLQSLIWIYFNGKIPEGFNVCRKDSNGLFQIENLELRCEREKGSSSKKKVGRRGSTSKFVGVCLSKNGMFWLGGTESFGPVKRFFTEIDAATYYDNIYFEKHSSRPNLTECRDVFWISRSLGNHLQYARRILDSGGMVGVFEDKRQKNNRFYARLGCEYLGKFQCAESAARAYNIAAHEKYGQHAALNDIPDPLGKGDAF